jgi:hypothetical protein
MEARSSERSAAFANIRRRFANFSCPVRIHHVSFVLNHLRRCHLRRIASFAGYSAPRVHQQAFPNLLVNFFELPMLKARFAKPPICTILVQHLVYKCAPASEMVRPTVRKKASRKTAVAERTDTCWFKSGPRNPKIFSISNFREPRNAL